MMCDWGFKVENNDTIYKFRWFVKTENNSIDSIEAAQKIANQFKLGIVTETSIDPYGMKGKLYRGESNIT